MIGCSGLKWDELGIVSTKNAPAAAGVASAVASLKALLAMRPEELQAPRRENSDRLKDCIWLGDALIRCLALGNGVGWRSNLQCWGESFARVAVSSVVSVPVATNKL